MTRKRPIQVRKKRTKKIVRHGKVTAAMLNEHIRDSLLTHPIIISGIPPGGKDGMILIQRGGKWVWEYPETNKP